MHHRVCRRSAFAVAALLLAGLTAAPSVALAADPPAGEKPKRVAELWLAWPKEGHQAEFLAAVKAHLAWRKQAGEKFEYLAYQPVIGDDLSYFGFRTGEHHWADLDANRAWARDHKADEKFDSEVMPHVARLSHYVTEDDTENS